MSNFLVSAVYQELLMSSGSSYESVVKDGRYVINHCRVIIMIDM